MLRYPASVTVRGQVVSSAGASSVGCEFSQVRVLLVRVNGCSSNRPCTSLLSAPLGTLGAARRVPGAAAAAAAPAPGATASAAAPGPPPGPAETPPGTRV
eukprot:8205583-Pyramimonas_sp.AAC.1